MYGVSSLPIRLKWLKYFIVISWKMILSQFKLKEKVNNFFMKIRFTSVIYKNSHSKLTNLIRLSENTSLRSYYNVNTLYKHANDLGSLQCKFMQRFHSAKDSRNAGSTLKRKEPSFILRADNVRARQLDELSSCCYPLRKHFQPMTAQKMKYAKRLGCTGNRTRNPP